jgi:dethiobiotin synthetase
MSNKIKIGDNLKFLIVGTDTGVGKTIFTGMLARYIVEKLGLKLKLAKPFCSGGFSDIDFLNASLKSENTLNYWYENDPISPGAWELRQNKSINIKNIIQNINDNDYDLLLIEGVGGLFAPLSRRESVATLGLALSAKLIVVAPNRVGVVNHVLLTVEAALRCGLSVVSVVLMGQREPDASAIDNIKLIEMRLPKLPDFKKIYEFPWLGENANKPQFIEVKFEKAERVIGEIFDEVINPLLLDAQTTNSH